MLDGPGGGGGSVLVVYMSKHVKEILNFTTYTQFTSLLKYSVNVHILYTLHVICTTEEYVNNGRSISPQLQAVCMLYRLQPSCQTVARKPNRPSLMFQCSMHIQALPGILII